MLLGTLISLSKVQATEPKTDWSYEGKTGPKYWGELDPNFKMCSAGKQQSPINIELSQVNMEARPNILEIQYTPSAVSVINDGHTIQANVHSEINRILLGGQEYTLQQFHFHTPSEHQLNGKNKAMELHLVHTNQVGESAVVGLLIEEGQENMNFKTMWEQLPEKKTEIAMAVIDPIPLNNIFPKDHIIFFYTGSLTTPPCTEEVKWIVFKEPIQMSKEQITAFRQIFPDNHRPVQPLEGRKILKGNVKK